MPDDRLTSLEDEEGLEVDDLVALVLELEDADLLDDVPSASLADELERLDASRALPEGLVEDDEELDLEPDLDDDDLESLDLEAASPDESSGPLVESANTEAT